MILGQVLSRRSEGPSWRAMHAKTREHWGLTHAPTWSAQKSLTLLPTLDRITDCVDICYAVHHKAARELKNTIMTEADEIEECDLILDCSQSVNRKPWSNHVRSICSGSLLYLFKADRCLLPEEHLLLLGWPCHKTRTSMLSAGQVRDLAGESMAMPCIATASAALMLNLPDTTLWPQP